jgi:hypothetical protein
LGGSRYPKPGRINRAYQQGYNSCIISVGVYKYLDLYWILVDTIFFLFIWRIQRPDVYGVLHAKEPGLTNLDPISRSQA